MDDSHKDSSELVLKYKVVIECAVTWEIRQFYLDLINNLFLEVDRFDPNLDDTIKDWSGPGYHPVYSENELRSVVEKEYFSNLRKIFDINAD